MYDYAMVYDVSALVLTLLARHTGTLGLTESLPPGPGLQGLLKKTSLIPPPDFQNSDIHSPIWTSVFEGMFEISSVRIEYSLKTTVPWLCSKVAAGELQTKTTDVLEKQ